ncbi:MAG: flagellar motor switch phosphatase FliY [Schwartzia succinivorans]|nr:flagellar motor switch phosphatase FliY [Schwartzia succinivorans]
MSDDMISQEEIDALLNGGGLPSGDAPAADAPAADAPSVEPPPAEAAPEGGGAAPVVDDPLDDMQKDALGEIGNISMGSAATTLSVLLGHKVSITTPTVSMSTMAAIRESYPMPYLIVEVGYTVGIGGNNILAIQASDACIIADLMMGGDGTAPPDDLNEIHMSAVGEAMNQMMGAVATSLSSMFNKKIDISPPKVNLIDLGTADPVTELVGTNEAIVKTSFRMEVDGLIDSEIMQILPVDIATEMVNSLLNSGAAEEEAAAPPPPPPAPAPAPQASPPPPPPPAPAPAPQAAAPPPPPMATAPPPMYGQQARVSEGIPVQAAQFTPLATAPVQVNEANIGLILDVPLQVTVELGRTKKSIKEILELTNGSIVELDKLAGEPVDIHVNGKFLAKGEVVVIDENFGVRITDIVSPEERAAKLQ